MIDVKELAKNLKDLSDKMTNLITDLTKEEAQAVIDELQNVHNFKFPEPKIIEIAKTEEKAEIKTFSVKLTNVGPEKLKLVKLYNAKTNLGLKPAKEVIDSAEKEPVILFKDLDKAEAESLKKDFEDFGGTIELI